MPVPIIAGAIVAGGTIAAASIASSGAKSAAKAQADVQQQAIAAQERAAEAERIERAEVARKEEEAYQEAVAKEEVFRQEAIARKETAIKEIKYPTYLEIPEAQKLKQTLEERLAGKGLTAPVMPLDIDRLVSPFATQRRASLTKETIPLISSAASARGLGRSTLPIKQIGEASQAAERDIEERVAQLQIQNKTIEESNIERERQQKENAIARYEALAGREITTQEARAIFERGGEFDIAETITGKAGAIGAAERETAEAIGRMERANAEAYRQNQFAIAESIGAKGATEAAYEMQQANIWASAISGLTQSAARSSEEIIDAINKQQTSRSAQLVNISGMGRVSAAPADYYLRGR